MKKSLIFLTVVGSIVAIVFFFYQGVRNDLIKVEKQVNAQWHNVESQYQRRSDLVSNIVATLNGSTVHEQSTLEDVIEARTKATQLAIDATHLNEHTLAQFQQAQSELESTINSLFISLNANQKILGLLAQLEAIENSIATERIHFNEASQEYNQLIHDFPGSIVANIENFIEKPYFKSQGGVNNSPVS